MKLAEIKAAVLSGKTVYVGSPLYTVKLDSIGQWLIVCKSNNYCIGLTWIDGETLNAEESEFYIKKA